ncbi:FKBP-type peptidyl-prolyl cis-trans isomerase [Salinibius halmophilus]|uniref:FKBP-type peptidyl-prolyl cis-trans isomerase n=1 Tax=Salinibius halmophilus TaxID=1853216 RepID=UPI000E66F4FB|nr:FKBP-type peptidyl-prolyl cis-trans isomerase [Salinibius halmophilus]
MINQDSTVTLHFELTLEDGSVVDSNFDGKPATFKMGDGNLLPGFEEVLVGLQAGDEQSFSMPPEKAFGQSNPANMQTFKRHEFGPDLVLEPGLVIGFQDPSGEIPGTISKLEGDFVHVDFNHPLAGKTIQFRVNIVDVA